MIDPSTLLVFATAVLLLLLSPGPNMAFVITQSMAYGWSGGAVSALGIGAADLVLTALTATGVTAVVNSWPPAFDLIRYAGAVYLLKMAYQAVRQPEMPGQAAASRPSLKAVFASAILNCLLNPKALLFFMVFLPQFVVPGKGMVAQQLMLLGGVLTLIGLVFHTVLGALGGSVRRWLGQRAKFARVQSLGLAMVLFFLAVRLIVMSRPA